MVDTSRPIGIFDSGVGGLTVVRAIEELMPQENLIYFGDTARFPFGPRPVEEVRSFALEIMDLMLREDVKMLVIACNAMTAAAYADAVQTYDLPVIGVIEPAVRAAVRATHNDRVGVLAQQATITTGQYERALREAAPRIDVYPQVCSEFVNHVEAGDTFSEELFDLAEGYLAPLLSAGVDTLILGCTHYPLLKGVLHSVTKGEVELVSSAEEVAKEVYSTLVERDLLRKARVVGERRFLVSGDPERFRSIGSRFLTGIGAVEQHAWEA